MSDDKLKKLIEDFRSGNEQAANDLFEMFNNEMAMVALRIARNYHTPQAIDIDGVVNSGFRSFFSEVNKSSFESRGGKIGGLLSTIVRRKALNRIRKLSSRPNLSHNDDGVLEFLLSEAGENFAENELVNELNELLLPILEKLTDKECSIVLAIFDPNETRSFEELALSFKTSKLTIEKLWSNLQSKISKHLE